MIQQQLYEWITHPERLNRDTLYELRTLLARYPYFQTVRLLYLKNLFLLHDITFGEELRKAALYVADRKILFYLIEGECFTVSSFEKQDLPKEEAGLDRTLSLIDTFLSSLPEEPVVMELPMDVTTDYTSFLLHEEEHVSDDIPQMKGQNLIDNFIEKSAEEPLLPQLGIKEAASVKNKVSEEEESEDNEEDMEDESYFTETLAKIYVKQQRYSKALEIIKKLKEISKKTKISEIYIARKCLELSNKEYEKARLDMNNKKAHIGYYLISEGEQTLLGILQNKKIVRQTYMKKAKNYILTLTIITIIVSAFFGSYINAQIKNILFSILLSILLLIPVETIITQIAQYILGKIKKTKIIPKLDYRNGVPEEASTFVVIPTIIKNGKRVEELMHKLEVYYIANKSDNIYFALLGDCSTSGNEEEGFDEEVINAGKKMVEILNKKYPDERFTKFNFIYRKRVWNEKEEAYLGWERKRGLLNQFNEYILGNISNPFKANTIQSVENMPNIKYIITLDADTDLVLNSAKELIGAMSHILNRPELNKSEDLVISGHALLQPRVGIDLMSSTKSLYTKIYAGAGGVDVYANAISDIYQDNFEEGIFTGKGIYDLEVFSKILNNEIPENTVLSHDLLEGSYLRCGLATDIMLMDGYPLGYNRQYIMAIDGNTGITKAVKKYELKTIY